MCPSPDTFDSSSPFSEFLIHAADVEGLCQGIDEELVKSIFKRLCNHNSHSKIHRYPRTRGVGPHSYDICRRRERLCKHQADLHHADVVAFLDISDLDLVDRLSGGRVDLTYGRYICSLLAVIHQFHDYI